MTAQKTIGFGVPNEMDPHHFTVDIPAARTRAGRHHRRLRPARRDQRTPGFHRALPAAARRLERHREEAKRVLNERLKEKKIATSRWSSGINKVERLLGRELCVLAWARRGGAEET